VPHQVLRYRSRASDPLVTIGFEHQLQRVPIVLIVIDDEDAGQLRCHEYLELFLHS